MVKIVIFRDINKIFFKMVSGKNICTNAQFSIDLYKVFKLQIANGRPCFRLNRPIIGVIYTGCE